MSGNTRNRGARWYKSERNDWMCCVWKVRLGAERRPSWVARPKRHRAGYLGNQGVVESAPVEGQSKLPALNSDSDIASFRNIRSSVIRLATLRRHRQVYLGHESHTRGRIQWDYTTTGYVEGHPFQTYIYICRRWKNTGAFPLERWEDPLSAVTQISS